MRLVAHASAVSCFLHTLCVIQHTTKKNWVLPNWAFGLQMEILLPVEKKYLCHSWKNMQMLISVKLSFLRHPVLFMYFILLPRNGIVLKLRPRVFPSYSAVFFSWQNWGKMNLFLQELFCDLFCNQQVAYIICCSCSYTKTKHSECYCLLLLTTNVIVNRFSISPSHSFWCRNWCSMSSMIHSSFPFCFLYVPKSFADWRDEILGRSAEQEWQFSLLRAKTIVEFVGLNFQTWKF